MLKLAKRSGPDSYFTFKSNPYFFRQTSSLKNVITFLLCLLLIFRIKFIKFFEYIFDRRLFYQLVFTYCLSFHAKLQIFFKACPVCTNFNLFLIALHTDGISSLTSLIRFLVSHFKKTSSLITEFFELFRCP